MNKHYNTVYYIIILSGTNDVRALCRCSALPHLTLTRPRYDITLRS